jgi:hypothetical protein
MAKNSRKRSETRSPTVATRIGNAVDRSIAMLFINDPSYLQRFGNLFKRGGIGVDGSLQLALQLRDLLGRSIGKNGVGYGLPSAGDPLSGEAMFCPGARDPLLLIPCHVFPLLPSAVGLQR